MPLKQKHQQHSHASEQASYIAVKKSVKQSSFQSAPQVSRKNASLKNWSIELHVSEGHCSRLRRLRANLWKQSCCRAHHGHCQWCTDQSAGRSGHRACPHDVQSGRAHSGAHGCQAHGLQRAHLPNHTTQHYKRYCVANVACNIFTGRTSSLQALPYWTKLMEPHIR